MMYPGRMMAVVMLLMSALTACGGATGDDNTSLPPAGTLEPAPIGGDETATAALDDGTGLTETATMEMMETTTSDSMDMTETTTSGAMGMTDTATAGTTETAMAGMSVSTTAEPCLTPSPDTTATAGAETVTPTMDETATTASETTTATMDETATASETVTPTMDETATAGAFDPCATATVGSMSMDETPTVGMDATETATP